MDADKKKIWIRGQFIEVTDEVYTAYMKGDRKIPQSPGGLRYVIDIFYFLADVRRFLCTSLPCSPLTGITDRKGVVSPSSNFDEGIIKGDF